MDSIAYLCGDSELGPAQKKHAKAIQTLTCHYRACSKFPDPPGGSNKAATIAEYKLSKGKLDKWFCQNTSNILGHGPTEWLKDHL